MEYLEMTKIIIILTILLVWTLLYFMSLINYFRFKVPQVSTFSSDFKVLKDNLWKYNLEWKKIADMWSGIGKVIRFLEKEFWAKPTGYEIDLSNVIIWKILNKVFWSKSKIIKWNYFEADLKKYDFIYIYLFPCLMEKVEEKIFSDAKKWTIIFVNAFKFWKHKPIDIFYKNWKEKIFVYKV